MHVCDHCDGGVDGDNDDGDAHDCGDDDDDSDDQHPRDNADCNALTVASLSHVAVRTGLVSLSLALWLTFLFAPCMSSDDQTYLERVHQLVLGLRWLEGELHKMTDCPIAISSVASNIADDALRLEEDIEEYPFGPDRIGTVPPVIPGNGKRGFKRKRYS